MKKEYPINDAFVASFVEEHDDDEAIEDAELVEAFRAAYGRDPDSEDRAQGLWSLICAA